MANNRTLKAAKNKKNDEFYTRYSDVEAEMNAYYEYDHDVFRNKTILLPCDDHEWSNFTKYFASNFTRFGLKKLISTSYAKSAGSKQLSLFEKDSPFFDEVKHKTHDKLFMLTRDTDGSGSVDTDDIEFKGYLKGDGDFRSKEVTKLRDEADIIITNPPFSKFIEFLTWIIEADKKFVILGNQNAIAVKQAFPLIKDKKMWLGYKSLNRDMYFNVTKQYQKWLVENKKEGSAYKIINGEVMGRLASTTWFTNLDHGKRHEILQLDTMEHNLKFNSRLKKVLKRNFDTDEYPHYDNYDAIEIPYVDSIPSDYDGVMGVPITFLDKYNPDQFSIEGLSAGNTRQNDFNFDVGYKPMKEDRGGCGVVNGKRVYSRILIKKK